MVAAVASFSTVTDTNGASPTIAIPSGTASGDILVAIMGADNDGVSSAMTAPSGWVLQGSDTSHAAGPMKVWTKVATASEPSTYSFGFTSASDCNLTVLRVTGSSSSPMDGSVSFGGQTTASTSHTAPASSPTATNSLRICAWNAMIVNTATWSAPSGFTLDGTAAQGNYYAHLMVGHKALSASGSTGTAVATTDNPNNSGGFGDVTCSFAIISNTGKIFAGSITPSGTAIKSIRKSPFGGSITATGALVAKRVVVRALSGSITATGAFAKQASKVLGGTITAIGVALKRTNKALGGSITIAATIRRSLIKRLTGSITPSGLFAGMDVGRVFGQPGIAVVTIVKAGWARMRVRRE